MNTEFVKVDKERFINTITQRNFSIRKLGKDRYIDRTEKTIRNYLNSGEMPADLLDRIALTINIHPDFLSGELDRDFDKLGGIHAKVAKFNLNPDDYPYIKAMQTSIGYAQHFKNKLTMCGISWEQYCSLPPVDRILFTRKLAIAEQQVIQEYFKTDALGNDTSDLCFYYESQLNDIDPDDIESEENFVKKYSSK